MTEKAYAPFVPAQRPGSSPGAKPVYRVLVHRKFLNQWNDMVDRVGLQQAQQFWDHVAYTPGQTSPVASITILRGKAGWPMAEGWSRTNHYEVTGAGRINYQFHNEFSDGALGDAHKVVTIRTIDYGSH